MRKYPWFTAPRRAIWASLCIAVVSILILVACGTATTANPAPTPQPPTAVPTPTPVPPISQATTVIVQMLESPPGHYFFKPDTLTIKAGTVVVWIDNSDAPHTVTSDPNAPNAFNTTSNVTQGKTFSLVFNTPGTYNYHCGIHPNMKAVITVTS
jgi:plastocyanin